MPQELNKLNKFVRNLIRILKFNKIIPWTNQKTNMVCQQKKKSNIVGPLIYFFKDGGPLIFINLTLSFQIRLIRFQNGSDPENRPITWILRGRRDHIGKIKIDAFEYVWIFVHNHVEIHTRIATNIN